ncbi:DNA polymerase III subunit chi [Parvularcula maris]|uniref:DNA polymerase III subunit chi n=1 Tax=Parvularcula maris TaxID=2965077 RepID=A0A9X2RIZ9_9PROT|nr:DNA polymerase III subunit chi [Parvularcula maris]MCQ8185416.1 DNA polymerase III subunit chi [Parvularcula maris]
MTEIFFYQLERSRLEEALPSLLEKTLAKGWRALVKADTPEALEALDEALWTYRDESFLPHGTSGAEEPVLLSLSDEAPNGAAAAFLTPGTEMDAEAMKGFERCVLLFDQAGTADARERWKALKAEGFDVTYWRQDARGRWEKAG